MVLFACININHQHLLKVQYIDSSDIQNECQGRKL